MDDPPIASGTDQLAVDAVRRVLVTVRDLKTVAARTPGLELVAYFLAMAEIEVCERMADFNRPRLRLVPPTTYASN